MNYSLLSFLANDTKPLNIAGLCLLLLPRGRRGVPELRQVRVLPRGARVQERPGRPAQVPQQVDVVRQGQAQLLRARGHPVLLRRDPGHHVSHATFTCLEGGTLYTFLKGTQEQLRTSGTEMQSGRAC